MALRWKILILLVLFIGGLFFFLARGVELKNLEFKSIKHFPAGNVLKLQRLFFNISSFNLRGIFFEVENARFFLPGSDPIVISGNYRQELLDINVFSHAISIRDLRGRLPKVKELMFLEGTIQSLDIFIKGKMEQPNFTGRFNILELEYRGSRLQECEGSFNLTAEKSAKDIQLVGNIIIEKGIVATPKTSIQLEESRVRFTGPVRSPFLKLRGNALIDRVKIRIAINGPKERPQVDLSSDPPMPQEALLLMLATGQRWKGMEESFDQGTLNPALTMDFVDYFLFGGSGRKMAQYFGISDVSLKLDKDAKGVTIKKDVTVRLGVGYGVEEKQQKTGIPYVSQKVEGEYKITDKISVGAQKEIQPDQSTGTASTVTPQTLPDDKVYMKYKLRF